MSQAENPDNSEFKRFLFDFTFKHVASHPWRTLVPELDLKFQKRELDLNCLNLKQFQKILPILEQDVREMCQNMFSEEKIVQEETRINIEEICQFYAARSNLLFRFQEGKSHAQNLQDLRTVCSRLEQFARELETRRNSKDMFNKIEQACKAFQFLDSSFIAMTANIFHFEVLEEWPYFTQGMTEILEDSEHNLSNILLWCFDITFQHAISLLDSGDESSSESEDDSLPEVEKLTISNE
jgi:hypothetical protein